MTAAELDAFLRTELPHMFRDGDLTIEHADGEICLLRQRYNDRMLRPAARCRGRR
jgi:hypothetical protein